MHTIWSSIDSDRRPLASRARRGVIAALLMLSLSPLSLGAQELAATDPLPAAVPGDAKIVFGDYFEEVETALELSGEKEKIGFGVEYANFTSGVESVEALRAGAADVARVGDVPPISAQRSGTILPIILSQQPTWSKLRFVVYPGRDINTLADLKGKKIVYSEGTSVALGVQRALALNNLQVGDVELVEVPLGSRYEALASGAADVGVISEPSVSRFLAAFPGAKVIEDEQTRELEKFQGLTYLIASPKALANPAKAAALQAFLAHYIRAEEWKNRNVDAWIEGYHVAKGTPRAAAEASVRDTGTATFPRLDDNLIAKQQSNADIFFETGEIPEKIDVSKAFDRRFNDIIVKTVAEVGAKHDLGE